MSNDAGNQFPLDDPLLALVGRSAPALDREFEDFHTRALVARLAAEVAEAAPRQARNPKRFARRLLFAAALTGALALTSALGYGIGARTGLFGDPSHTETDGSEWLFTAASDYRETIEGLVPDIELPPGVSWDPHIDRAVSLGIETPALLQETGVKGSMAFYAHCAWVGAWMDAEARGDRAGAASAEAALAAAPHWPEITAIDGGGVADSMARVAAAASRGAAGEVREFHRLICQGQTGEPR